MVEKAIVRAMDSLASQDMAAAESIVHDDLLINSKRFDIEEQTLRLVALRRQWPPTSVR